MYPPLNRLCALRKFSLDSFSSAAALSDSALAASKLEAAASLSTEAFSAAIVASAIASEAAAAAALPSSSLASSSVASSLTATAPASTLSPSMQQSQPILPAIFEASSASAASITPVVSIYPGGWLSLTKKKYKARIKARTKAAKAGFNAFTAIIHPVNIIFLSISELKGHDIYYTGRK